MTAIAPRPIVSRPSPPAHAVKGGRLSKLLRTTDHKTIGLMYLTTAMATPMPPDPHVMTRSRRSR